MLRRKKRNKPSRDALKGVLLPEFTHARAAVGSLSQHNDFLVRGSGGEGAENTATLDQSPLMAAGRDVLDAAEWNRLPSCGRHLRALSQ